MDDDERNVLHKCFAKTKELFMKQNSSEDWSHNLIEGSSELSTPLQWKHFYVWLANPNNYNEEETAKLSTMSGTATIEPYADCFKVDTIQNGPCETIINVVNTNTSEQEDEKQEEVVA